MQYSFSLTIYPSMSTVCNVLVMTTALIIQLRKGNSKLKNTKHLRRITTVPFTRWVNWKLWSQKSLRSVWMMVPLRDWSVQMRFPFSCWCKKLPNLVRWRHLRFRMNDSLWVSACPLSHIFNATPTGYAACQIAHCNTHDDLHIHGRSVREKFLRDKNCNVEFCDLRSNGISLKYRCWIDVTCRVDALWNTDLYAIVSWLWEK